MDEFILYTFIFEWESKLLPSRELFVIFVISCVDFELSFEFEFDFTLEIEGSLLSACKKYSEF